MPRPAVTHWMSPSLVITCMGFMAAGFAAGDFFSCAEALDPRTQREPRTTATTAAFLMACLPVLAWAGRDVRLPAKWKDSIENLFWGESFQRKEKHP